MPAPPSRSFDLSERITDRLRDLVAKYPKGLGIVKEFLQNADDAGASGLLIIYDRRQHEGTLDDPGMRAALGPALLFMNDQPFSPADLEHIQTISDSSKRANVACTGRFGQGFCTAYSVSDEPILLTDDTLVWFDPHRRIHERNRNAYAWDLRPAANQWPALVATFAPAGAAMDGTPFAGTIFRLPLRTSANAGLSEIRREPFTDGDWERILAEARAMGPALLVFLRSILRLEVYEISPSGEKRLRLAIRTKYEDLVRRARAPLRAASGRPLAILQAWKASDAELPSTAFTHGFEVVADDGQPQVETWEVINHLCRGPEDALLDESMRLCEAEEKVLPWAGAAARRDGHSSSLGGGFACFLPLPEAGDAPVWLHGWFALDSSARRSLARVAVEEQSKRHVAWNRLLMMHAVGPAWATLLVRLRANAATTKHPYERWPVDAAPTNKVDAACVAGFYQTVKPHPVFRARRGATYEWYDGLQPLVALPAHWQAKLETAMSSSKTPVLAPPLPENVLVGLELSNGGPRLLAPETLRRNLQALGRLECPISSAPRAWLSRPEWITQIAAYCASDGKERLCGLPLALLRNGFIRNFDPADPVYLTRAEDRTLLEPFPRRTLDDDYQKTLFHGKAAPGIGVRALDVSALLELAAEFDGTTRPPGAWLRSFFTWLEQAPTSQIAPHTKTLQRLAVVPGPNGVLREPGQLSTPLLPGDDDALRWALERLGVEFVVADSALLGAIAQFSRRHDGFVWHATAEVVARILVAMADELEWQSCDDHDVLTAILDLLSTVRWNKVATSTLEGLRRLPLLPTSGGGRVAATQSNTYVLVDFEPPALVATDLYLIDARRHPGWVQVFERLGVRTLDAMRFATEIVLPAFVHADALTQDALLRWLRDELPKLEPSFEEGARLALHRKIRTTAILSVHGGGLQQPSLLYAPDVPVERLLGSFARKPDPARFSEDAHRWGRFFQWLRLHRSPRPVDLYAAIQELVKEAERHDVEAVRPALLRMIAHLDEHWESLHDREVVAETSLGSALSVLAWLPARLLSAEECAMAAAPEHRLYRACELAANSIRNLVASQRPIMDGSFGVGPSDELGVVRDPEPHEVLAHFNELQTAPIPSSPRGLKAIRSAFVAIVRYFGSKNGTAIANREWHSTDEVTRNILIGGTWRSPEKVFFNALTTALPGACSVQDDPELAAAAAQQTSVRKGLEVLGVRASPTHEDWLTVLQRLVIEHGPDPLADDAIKVANGALLQLRTAEDEWLRSRVVHVLTDDQRLIPARDAFLPGDPRLRHSMVTPIPIVASAREIMDVARRSGARLLHEALEDNVDSGTKETTDPGHRGWTTLYEGLLRSAQFQGALQRLAFQEALQERSVAPSLSNIRDRVRRSRRLRLKITDHLRVQSRLLEEPMTVVFDFEVSSSFDDQSGTLWLAAAPDRRMRDEVVRAVSRQCGVNDTLSLSRLLEREPNEMHVLLDEDGVAPFPAERELDESDVAAHDSALATQGVADWDTPQDHGAEFEHDDRPDLDVESTGTMSSAPPPIRSHPSIVPQKGGSILRHVDPGAARPLTDGSSRPWSPDAATVGHASQWNSQRLRTYLHAHSQADYDTSSAACSTADAAHAAALAEVQRRALQDGLSVAVADATLDGYDLVVGGPANPRFVRVIGIEGPWTARGVRLTKRDFETAQRERTRWALHVVEHACDAGRIEVHELQNPLDFVEELRLDDGWRNAESGARCSDPVVGDVVTMDDGRRATVVHVEAFGAEYEVELQSDNALPETKVWQPRWKQS